MFLLTLEIVERTYEYKTRGAKFVGENDKEKRTMDRFL